MTDTELARIDETVIAQSAAMPAPTGPKPRLDVMRIEEHASWPVLSKLSIPVSAEIPLAGFKVRDLLALESGQLVCSAWPETEDVMAMAGGVQAGWSEFEVEDQTLLVRLTRLA